MTVTITLPATMNTEGGEAGVPDKDENKEGEAEEEEEQEEEEEEYGSSIFFLVTGPLPARLECQRCRFAPGSELVDVWAGLGLAIAQASSICFHMSDVLLAKT